MKQLICLLLITFLFLSCEEERVNLEGAVKSIKEQYRGDVKATIQKSKNGGRYLLIELTDTLGNAYSNDVENFASRFVKSAFCSLNDEQRVSFDFVRITFSDSSQLFFQNEVPINLLVKEDSIRQMRYCDILPDIFSPRGLSIYLNEITEDEFYQVAHEEIKLLKSYPEYINNDSLENILNTMYREKFKFINNCYLFPANENGTIEICRRTNPNNDRDFESYKLVQEIDGFFLFEVIRFEDGEYIVFNSKSGKAFSLTGYPIYSTSKKYVYSSTGGYSNESYVSIMRLTDNKDITLSFNDWDILEDYYIGEEGIRFKLRSSVCKQQYRYLDIRFVN